MRLLPPLLAVVVLLLAPVVAAPAAASTRSTAPARAAQYDDQDAEDYAVEDDNDSSDPDGSYSGDAGQQAEDVSPPAAPAPAPLAPLSPAPLPQGPPVSLIPPLVTTGTVAGRQALMRADGKAAIPRGAPARVRAIIAAANLIVGKRYKWGGGHARLIDSGYDCSGAISYALIRSGELSSPLVSGSFAHWGLRGAGAYVTLYANSGHVYAEIAGLRLDTSAVGDPGGRAGVRWRPAIGKRRGFAARRIPRL